jgi:hypothetical protein
MENQKSETRNPNQIRNQNDPMFRVWDFWFDSSFWFRISDFGLLHNNSLTKDLT